MRILNLIPHLSAGGAERQLSYLAPEMAKAGNDVHIAYVYDGPERPPMSGVKLHRIELHGNHDPSLFIKVYQLFGTLKPDIIQSWIEMMDIVVGCLCHLADLMWVVREPTTSEFYINPTLKQKLRSHLITGKAKAIICNSAGGISYWRSNGVKENLLNLIPNAVTIDIINGLQRSLKRSARDETLLYAGRLVPSKNVDLVINAIAETRRYRNVSLVVIGRGPEERNLIKLVDHLDIKVAVRFLGYVESQRLRDHMLEADAFISLSAYEGMPNAVCEAAALGIPLILSDIPAHRAIFDEESAFFTSVNSVTKIAGIICHALIHRQEAAQKAARALEFVNYRSPSRVASEYLDLYNKLQEGAGDHS